MRIVRLTAMAQLSVPNYYKYLFGHISRETKGKCRKASEWHYPWILVIDLSSNLPSMDDRHNSVPRWSENEIRRLGSQRYAIFVSLHKIRLKPSFFLRACDAYTLMADLGWGKMTRKEEAVSQCHSAGRVAPHTLYISATANRVCRRVHARGKFK